jgi:hypothetical protein
MADQCAWFSIQTAETVGQGSGLGFSGTTQGNTDCIEKDATAMFHHLWWEIVPFD